jgi:hypothetical protein
MAFKITRDCESQDLVGRFPLTSINDDFTYSNAIAILDCLFELGEQRSPDETEYFHLLAMLACEYEEASVNAKKGVRAQ